MFVERLKCEGEYVGAEKVVLCGGLARRDLFTNIVLCVAGVLLLFELVKSVIFATVPGGCSSASVSELKYESWEG